jgi:hypothetical protein
LERDLALGLRTAPQRWVRNTTAALGRARERRLQSISSHGREFTDTAARLTGLDGHKRDASSGALAPDDAVAEERGPAVRQKGITAHYLAAGGCGGDRNTD